MTHFTTSLEPEENRRRIVLTGVALLTVGWAAPIASYLASALRANGGAEIQGTTIAVVLTLVGASAVWWLPDGYHALREWERQGRVYSLIGVGRFRHFVLGGRMLGGWPCAAGGRTSVAIRGQLCVWSDRGRTTERHHVAAMLMSLPSLFIAGRSGPHEMATYLIVGNLVFNVYPILLQRYTRGRLERSVAGRVARG